MIADTPIEITGVIYIHNAVYCIQDDIITSNRL